MKTSRTTGLNLPALRLEGSLFLPDILEKAALGQSRLQTEADYGLPKGLKLRDEASRAFQIASAQWRIFAALLERSDFNPQRASVQFVSELLRDALAYPAVAAVSGVSIGDRTYPITHLAHPAPAAHAAGAKSVAIVIAPHNQGLDDSDPRFAVQGSGAKRKSPFQLAQEFLNASPAHEWALVSNGRTLRLLRDAATLTRPSYLEVDLQDLLAGQRFVEFRSAWHLLQASRAGLLDLAAEDATKAPPLVAWATWQQAGQEEGTRVREGLRRGVTEALITLGQGFIQNPANDALRVKLQAGGLTRDNYFAQLLRLVYRFIFVFTAEERGLIPAAAQPGDDDATVQARHTAAQLYAEGYAMARLRDLALRRRAQNRHNDLWQAVRIVFRGLGKGQSRLGLPALGGLFADAQCPDLDDASLNNAALLAAIKSLRWTSTAGGSLTPISYHNMDTEELGSVYESLLELVPDPDVHNRSFGFVGLTSEGSTAGNERKTSGSYYTPKSLVQELIRSALDPVIEDRIAQNAQQPVEALLSLKVVDPACGSGHFLLAAARRIAERVAALRSADGAITPQAYRHAMREVVARCIFGVDRNPMAIELARTALWIEGFEEGRPLSFLDHHLRVGDALLGLTDLKALEHGIAKDAFKVLSGDDKAVCKELTKANSTALKDLEKKRLAKAFGQLDVVHQTDSGLAALQAIEAMPEGDTLQIAAKAQAYDTYLTQARTGRLALAANQLLGAYLLPKTDTTADTIPTTATLYLTLLAVPLKQAQQAVQAQANAACEKARVLHWPLAFPQVFAAGGFDCVLGNPPWERIKLQEEEFFATRHTAIAAAKNKAERSQRIQWLSEGMLAQHLYPGSELGSDTSVGLKERELYTEFITARRTAEAASLFAHVKGEDGGRYPLTGVGDVNTYALFAETIKQITSSSGRAGFIVPSGLATDNSTKDFFGHLISSNTLASFYEFENEGFFPGAGQGHMLRFALTTVLGHDLTAEQPKYLFQGKKISDLLDENRVLVLSGEDIALVNPNTLTCPVFQSKQDAELTKKIYERSPIIDREKSKGLQDGNPWGVSFMRMFDMSNDSHLFKSRAELIDLGFQIEQGNNYVLGRLRYLPLYEAKMLHLFNHRYGDFELAADGQRAHILPDVPLEKLSDQEYVVQPYYWVPEVEVRERTDSNQGFFAFRSINNSANARAFIGTVLPLAGVGNSAVVMHSELLDRRQVALWGCLSSITFEYLIRQKLGGTNMNLFILRQMPVPAPHQFTDREINFIYPRFMELVFTAQDLTPWARSVGYHGDPFKYDTLRRPRLAAELDAFFASKYGLTRNELHYILDPEAVMGDGFPSEALSVLKSKELKELGEYRTRRLVLEAWDRLHAESLH
ncbi:restriction endonuclease [Acidovorax temperans]|uniref:site-specific DNA-methyltransferase (adenine-specific) n=1 Tax=Acidovorax temperans TaxID=80878 RepID=A0A0D7KAA5_9BURK|nr:N-6 DNA methylase [Acidovorax temperans]KJA10113.1 restriction endonuclease [Acidovorax temperans]